MPSVSLIQFLCFRPFYENVVPVPSTGTSFPSLPECIKEPNSRATPVRNVLATWIFIDFCCNEDKRPFILYGINSFKMTALVFSSLSLSACLLPFSDGTEVQDFLNSPLARREIGPTFIPEAIRVYNAYATGNWP